MTWAAIGAWLVGAMFVLSAALVIMIIAVPDVARMAAAALAAWADAMEYFWWARDGYIKEARARAAERAREKQG